MTKEDLIAMARQAGAFPELSTTPDKDVEFLRRFAKLIEARTREECAKVCENLEAYVEHDPAQSFAYAIRAMGERT